ncbi:MAG: NADH-quinone oxidoreductase subunit NuoF [Acidobacteria bacterium]|nr:NADH-quinone oxidoreductase subunit NuoF [Acidobacteriota bacterium]
MAFEKVLTRNVGNPAVLSLAGYEAAGGYVALRKALKEMTPIEVTEEVQKSGLRGRGGAGFPTGVKWGFVPRGGERPVYLINNADESEPGTSKDRLLMTHDPHLVLEGTMISAYALECHHAFIYIRGEYVREYEILMAALTELREKGYLGRGMLGSDYDLQVTMVRGAGAYICGEETALMNSLEGRRGEPRLKPPFPAQRGIFGSPTNVNNTETLANVPFIIERGADWFTGIGKERNTGPKLYCVSGHVKNPGIFELPMTITCNELIQEHAGGMLRPDHAIKAFIPGGSSVPVLRADELDVIMSYDDLAEAGTMLGSAGGIVMDDTTCMVDALRNLEAFYAHESCGQCTPCRQGCGWLHGLLTRLENGGGVDADIPLITELADNIEGHTICPLGDAAAMPARAMVAKFKDEFRAHVARKGCPLRDKVTA